MPKKMKTTKKGAGKTGKKMTKAEELAETAKKVFEASGKEAYYLGDRAINNLDELRENIHDFREEHAPWVADWLEYLGDTKAAQKIRETPEDLKEIVEDRYKELKKAL